MSTTRTVTLTVYAIEAATWDISSYADPPSSLFAIGTVTVKALGQGHEHSWHMRPGERRYWPGDTVTVTVIEDDPLPSQGGNDLAIPPIDGRTR